MSKLKYLYNVDKAVWKDLTYMEAFKLKNKLANNVLAQIQCQHYALRDEHRKIEVIKAIKFNEKRMRE